MHTSNSNRDEGFKREKRSFFMTTTVLSNTAIKQNDVKSMNLETNTHTHMNVLSPIGLLIHKFEGTPCEQLS